MPVWLARAQHAQKLGMTIPELEWWLNEGGGSEYYRKLCAAWALEAEHAPRRQQRAQRDAALRSKYSDGGPTDPLLSCSFKDMRGAA